MKAIQITQTGGPEVMSIREVQTSVPGPGEVLIRVAASGVNFIDLYVREGRYAIRSHSFLGRRVPVRSPLLAKG